MSEINVTPKRTYQGRITPLSLPRRITLPKTPHTETPHPTEKKEAVQGRELPRIALIQIGSGYSGGGDEAIRSSWDVRICVYQSFE
jgi:hypothetical protein